MITCFLTMFSQDGLSLVRLFFTKHRPCHNLHPKIQSGPTKLSQKVQIIYVLTVSSPQLVETKKKLTPTLDATGRNKLLTVLTLPCMTLYQVDTLTTKTYMMRIDCKVFSTDLVKSSHQSAIVVE